MAGVSFALVRSAIFCYIVCFIIANASVINTFIVCVFDSNDANDGHTVNVVKVEAVVALKKKKQRPQIIIGGNFQERVKVCP